MVRTIIIKNQIVHSQNPYIHKCCGCIHLRMGAALSCIIWMGLSLYFAILSFQAKSPFYSYIDNTVMYLFGTINLIFFGVCFGTLIPIYLGSTYGIRSASRIVILVVAVLLIDVFVNTILFIVRKDNYIQWCIDSTSGNLDSIFKEQQIPITEVNGIPSFNTEMRDFYNCNRTWENELKFAVLSTIVMIILYLYWAISMLSYSMKLRIELKQMMLNQMSHMPMMMAA